MNSDIREVELRLNEIKTQLNEASRQEQEAQRIKLENTIRFPASALMPDPLHNQIMAQISHNKMALMNQFRATEHHLLQMKELSFQINQSQTVHSEQFDFPRYEQSFPLNIQRETVAPPPPIPQQSSSPGSVTARHPFARPPFAAPNRMSRPPIELLDSHSNEYAEPKMERPRPAPVELINNDSFNERGTSQNSVTENRLQEDSFFRPRNPAPCDIKANVGRNDDNTGLPYVINNPSMFNSRRFEMEPEFRDWCIKYDIVTMKRKPEAPPKPPIEVPVINNHHNQLSRARTHLQRSPPKSNHSYSNRNDNHQPHQGSHEMLKHDRYSEIPRMPVRGASIRMPPDDLSEREIACYDREYFDENHGPDPSHPYYSTWYNRFIKRPSHETRDHRHSSELKSSYRSHDGRSKPEDRHNVSGARRHDNYDNRHYSSHKPPLPPTSPDNLRIEDMFRGSPSLRIDRDEKINDMSRHTTPTPPPLPKEDAPPPPPMVPPPKAPEKPADVYQLDQMLSVPGRKEQQRLRNSLIIMRGAPGSGKSYIAKTIKDKEVAAGMTAPRILSIDDYFMVTDESSKKGGMVYEYEEEMEAVYLAALAKALSKVVAEGSDRLVIIDACNSQVQHFHQFIDVAQKSLMKVYLVEMQTPVSVCLEQNIHNRSEDEIRKLIENWEVAPAQFPRLDPAHFMSARHLAKDKETSGATSSNDKGRKLTENRQAPSDKSSTEGARKRRRSDSMELSDVEEDATSAPIMTNAIIAPKKPPLPVQYYEPGDPTVSPVHSSHSFDESEETAAEKEQLLLPPPSSSTTTTATPTANLEEDSDGGGDYSDHSSEEGSPPPPGCAFFPIKSKWENTDNSENALDRMDGFKSAHHGTASGEKATPHQQAPRESIEDFLSSCGESYFERKSNSQSGKKRVRWADVEERREIEQEKRLGFIVGRTNWDRIVNDEDQMTATALTKTKFF